MKYALLLVWLLNVAWGQAPVGATAPDQNLPAQPIGADDLIAVSVYDRPELNRTVRVKKDGRIDLPLLSGPLVAGGLLPEDLQRSIAEMLVAEEILVHPVVSVAVVEYRSRPVSVVGAVKRPLTFQVSGRTQLLDALARAEGLTSDAGSEVLVTLPEHDGVPAFTHRVSVKSLINDASSEANLVLTGGEQIRVPEAGKVFVVGSVRRPGAFLTHDNEHLTVLKVLALSEGLMQFAGKEAFLYRQNADGDRKEEMIPLRKIVDRKSPDVQLSENDILYIPENRKQKMTISTLERLAQFGGAAGSAAIYAGTR